MAQNSLCVDDDVKRSAEQAFDDIGLSMSVARERRIPFELSADPFYFESNQYALSGKENGGLQGRTDKFS